MIYQERSAICLIKGQWTSCYIELWTMDKFLHLTELPVRSCRNTLKSQQKPPCSLRDSAENVDMGHRSIERMR